MRDINFGFQAIAHRYPGVFPVTEHDRFASISCHPQGGVHGGMRVSA